MPRPILACGALCALVITLSAAPAGAATAGFERDLNPPAVHSPAKSKPLTRVQRIADLAGRYPRLQGAERRAAASLLQRPTDGASDPNGNGWKVPEAPNSPYCSAHFCVHWVDSTADAPSLTDANGNGIPDHIEQVSAVAENAYTVENGQLGWRVPKSDGANGGGNGLVDVYLAQLGGTGVFGYTSPDPGQPQGHSLSSYLVLDNDYAPNEFRGYTDPSLPLDVTLAHEYNHVLHFTYDAVEDTWMFECSAVWMEDQVYTDINDYLQYLPRWATLTAQPITQFQGAQTGVDTGTSVKVYGSAVWNQWLAERYGNEVVRNAWERSVAAKSFAPAAFNGAIRAHGGNGFSDDFSRFAAATAEWRAAGSGFPEGAAYPDVTRAGDLPVDQGGGKATLDHTAYALANITGATTSAKVKLAVTVPKGTAAALALVGLAGGRPVVKIQNLPKGGAGVVSVTNPGRFSRLTAALINADTKQNGFDRTVGDWQWVNDKQPFLAVASTDFKPPQIKGTAATAGRVKVTFSERVRGVDSKSLRLLAPNGKRLSARVKFKPGSKVATLTPRGSLVHGGLYRLSIGDGITDLALNALRMSTSAAFRAA